MPVLAGHARSRGLPFDLPYARVPEPRDIPSAGNALWTIPAPWKTKASAAYSTIEVPPWHGLCQSTGTVRSVMGVKKHKTRMRILVAVVATAWLPYTLLRCFDNPDHSGCPMMNVAAKASEPESHDHAHHDHHSPAAQSAGHHSHDGVPSSTKDHERGQDTCCELTGKCNVLVTTTSTLVDAPAPIGLAPSVVVPLARDGRVLAVWPGSVRIHGPPIYLANETLIL